MAQQQATTHRWWLFWSHFCEAVQVETGKRFDWTDQIVKLWIFSAGGLGWDWQAWMCQCLFQCETEFILFRYFSIQTFLMWLIVFYKWWNKKLCSGSFPAFLSVHQPGCLQLRRRWQPHQWLHVLPGCQTHFLNHSSKVLNQATKALQQSIHHHHQGTACSSCPTSTTCVDSLCQAAWIVFFAD